MNKRRSKKAYKKLLARRDSSVKLCNRKYAEIIREDGWALLYDGDDGQRGVLHSFPESMTDEQILDALDFANRAYETGCRVGREEKAAEVRKILGVKP